jgi:hypothetical protein
MNIFARAIRLLSIIPIGFALAQSGNVPSGNRDNAGKLQVAWTWKAQNFGPRADPETGILYVPSVTNPSVAALVHDPQHSDMDYIGNSVFLEKIDKSVLIIKPPYGRITAIDLNSGDHLWMIPNGQPPDEIQNNPALKGTDTSKFGGAYASTFRALDKKTGDTIFELKLPAPLVCR